MKKFIEITITLNNPSDQAVNEIVKATDNMLEDIEHLLPIADLTIRYTKN